MGVKIDIAKLYEVEGSSEFEFLIISCERPEYPNWDGGAEVAAAKMVEEKFQIQTSELIDKFGLTVVKEIASWPDCYPDGDQFYQQEHEGFETVWLSLEHAHGKYFIFGDCKSEKAFWESAKELHDSGELFLFEEFERPAKRVGVMYAQSRT